MFFARAGLRFLTTWPVGRKPRMADNKLTKLRCLSPQANYTDRLSDRRLSAKLVPTLVDRGCRVVSATIPPQLLISVF
jgi:hypothetical protein